ncbi:MAG: site-specific DNA-methyltransferase [Polyangiaceae bacterium]|nr:site-specific DNA-methyltransferase [Polyangiaceae bacterium]
MSRRVNGLIGPLFDGNHALFPEQRRIGQGPPPPPHKPTTAVPPGLLQAVDADIRRACEARARAIAAQLRRALGEPYYVREGFILYNTDCRVVLRELAKVGTAVNLTLTSPPYNIGKDYEEPKSLGEYVGWCSAWMNEVWGVTAPGGAFWLNLGYLSVEGKGRAVPIAYILWDKSLFYLQQEVVWSYGAGVTAKRFFAPRNEKWLFYTKDANDYTFNLDDVRDPNVKYPNQKKNGKFRCNPLGKNPSDVWDFPKVTTGSNRSSRERTPHPAQFPLGVVDRIVKVSSDYSDVLLDPFSGSGSSGIAAVGNGRVYIGVELREDYCRASAERHERFLAARDDEASQAALSVL